MSTSIITGKKLHRQNPAVVSDLGCGCSRPKLANLFFRQWPRKPTSSSTKADPSYSLSPSESFTPTAVSTSITTSVTSLTSSDSAVWPSNGLSWRIKESFAVLKDSDDPYMDFRRSMLQMIVEKKIYGKEELQELLTCFLFLNSPDHHEVIIKAFVGIWNGVYQSPEKMKSRDRGKHS